MKYEIIVLLKSNIGISKEDTTAILRNVFRNSGQKCP